MRYLIPLQKSPKSVLVHIPTAARASCMLWHGYPPILLPLSPHEQRRERPRSSLSLSVVVHQMHGRKLLRAGGNTGSFVRRSWPRIKSARQSGRRRAWPVRGRVAARSSLPSLAKAASAEFRIARPTPKPLGRPRRTAAPPARFSLSLVQNPSQLLSPLFSSKTRSVGRVH